MKKEGLDLFIEGAAAAVIAFVASLPPAVLVLVCLQGVDVITGFMSAYITKTIDSGVSFTGLMKKALVLVTVGASKYLGDALGLPDANILPTAIAGFYSMHESISILENLVKADVPLPKPLIAALRAAQREGEVQ